MVLGKPFLFLLGAFFSIWGAWGQSFEEKYYANALPHFEEGKTGTFLGTGRLPLFYHVFQVAGSSKAIAIVPGYTENAEKYAELIYDFNQAGYSVYILDHRGMGRSARETSNPQVVHVEDFNHYVFDQQRFFQLVVSRGPEKDRFVFAHSAGGLIAAKLLAAEPGLVKAAVLNAPLFKLNTGKFDPFLANTLATSLDWIGRGKSYAPGFSDFDPKSAKITPKSSCRDPLRFAAYMKVLIEKPGLRMGGPSIRWVREVLSETDPNLIRKLAKAVKTPVLIFQAGSDSLVLPEGQQAFCASAPNCTLRRYPSARHEIWREPDVVRDDAIGRTIDFFKSHESTSD